MDSLPPDVLAAVFDFLSFEEAARVSDATRSKYRNIFQACIEGRQLFMPTSWQNQLTLVSDIEIEFTSIFASFRVVARMCLHEGEDYDERIRLLEARVHCPMLRMAYLFECWQNDVNNSRVLHSPCVWCGIPTEKQCFSFAAFGAEAPECEVDVCNDCNARYQGCRRCTASVGHFVGLPESIKAQWTVYACRLAYGKDHPHDRDLGFLPPEYDNSPGSYAHQSWILLANQLTQGNNYYGRRLLG